VGWNRESDAWATVRRFTRQRQSPGHWPAKGGAKHREARQAVLSALERAHDRMLLEKARKAFADAAKEADILFD
jgi:hypothetical protein